MHASKLFTLASALSLAAAAPAQRDDIITTAAKAGTFRTLVTAVVAGGLTETLSRDGGHFTVFAPSDAAFEKLPKGTLESLFESKNRDKLRDILANHVVEGSLSASKIAHRKELQTVRGNRLAVEAGKTVRIAGALVTKTDILASNGVIHVVDTVLLPPKKPSDIVDTAIAAGQFKTLVAAVQAAGLEKALRQDGPFTVFAPTDTAFGELGRHAIRDLLKEKNRKKLATILKTHVVSGAITAREAIVAQSATTLQDNQLQFEIIDGRLTVNGATVIASDIQAGNGVIHIIDSVLLPAKKAR